jgi:CRP-like cAMP-binding protein
MLFFKRDKGGDKLSEACLSVIQGVEMVLTRSMPCPSLAECNKDYCAPLFSDLRDEEFTELQGLMVPISYEAGDLICQEGMPGNGICVICKGLVKCGKYSADRSRKRILKIAGARDILGLEILFGPDPCLLTGFAKALEDTKVAFIEKGRFLEFLKRHPAILFHLCGQLIREISVYQCRLVELAYGTTSVNLARLLLILARRFGVRREEGVEIEFSRSDLAELAGMRIDTLVRALGQLREGGLIATRYRTIRILDETGLEAVASPVTTCLEENLF